ncbi:unnamed protein product [Didymodactylos carnosus]|uniref:Uncharacterized protein n=1 Tax=Didymodactylos carnosus TaxID=1234261 RepID=A0A814WPX1_9BILA|nr:unnamed protein product [Didymodactylos carnosus]CAF1204578.1 unnamed protein product [Didymodactylos carnosus]CAF3626814.1 unnamed protein product [Didymodactylos carnosus]CAF3968901.1 unnamed protein product [Didymodactylos carnosus]
MGANPFRSHTCGSSDNTYCSENPTGNPPGYACFCPDNQFTFNKPCSELTTTTKKMTTTTSNGPILTPNDYLSPIKAIINVTENGTVVERNQDATYGPGAGARGAILRSVGIHRVRFRIERMYLSRRLFIGVYSPHALTHPLFPSQTCRYADYDEIAALHYDGGWKCYTQASGWFANDSIAVRGNTYDHSNPAGPTYTSNYEQYYMTNDVITLTMNCEEGTLTLKNERTNKEYHMFIDDVQNDVGRLPWKLYINLYYPGDKIRLLSSEDD